MFLTTLSKNNYPVLLFQGKALHSKIDPLKEGDYFFNESKDFLLKKEEKALVIFGLGLGYLLSTLAENKGLSKNVTIFAIICSNQEEVLFKENTPLFIQKAFSFQFINPSIKKDLCTFTQMLMHFSYNNILLKINPNVYNPLKNEYGDSFTIIENIIKRKLFNVITESAFGKRWWHNMVLNYSENIIYYYNINKSHTPFLLVGSGLSFYENLQLIKMLFHKGVSIICVLPVLEILLEWGIKPTFVLVTDGGEANRHYTAIQKLSQYTDTTLCLSFQVYYELLRFSFGCKTLFFNSGLELEELLTPNFPFIISGGSVASSILLFALKITPTVYYTGFDFRFTKKHPHFPGAPLELAYTYKATRCAPLESTMTKKVYGNAVTINNEPTSFAMKAYYDHFYELVKENQNRGFKIEPLQGDFTTQDMKATKNENYYTITKKLESAEKIRRLQLLLEKLRESLKLKNYSDPFLTPILSRSLLKNEDCEEVLKQEIEFIEKVIAKGVL